MRLLLCFLFTLLVNNLKGQQTLSEYNLIGWYSYMGDHKLTQKWEVHLEYQWRRTHLITSWQQSLARGGLNYNWNNRFKTTLGYGFIETYPYGDYPSAKTGHPFPEHRIYLDLNFKYGVDRIDIANRLRLEQRWQGELEKNAGRKMFGWANKKRARYQLKFTIPVKGSTIDPKEIYLCSYDEVFFDLTFNSDVLKFDQNRLFIGLGYLFDKNFKMEGGFLNQASQRNESTQNSSKIIEKNYGLSITVNYSFDFSKN